MRLEKLKKFLIFPNEEITKIRFDPFLTERKKERKPAILETAVKKSGEEKSCIVERSEQLARSAASAAMLLRHYDPRPAASSRTRNRIVLMPFKLIELENESM